MKRIIQRLVVILGVSGGLVTAAATLANAKLASNHCEPVARDHR